MLDEKRLKRQQIFVCASQFSVLRGTECCQLPRCDVVGKLKIELGMAATIGNEGRLPEHCLGEILAQSGSAHRRQT